MHPTLVRDLFLSADVAVALKARLEVQEIGFQDADSLLERSCFTTSNQMRKTLGCESVRVTHTQRSIVSVIFSVAWDPAFLMSDLVKETES